MEPIIIAEGIEIAAEIVFGAGVGAAVSEALPFFKKTKHNGLLHLAWNILKAGFDLWKKRGAKQKIIPE
jgi:hypothetical protein